MKRSAVQLKKSSRRPLQMGGASEKMNRMMENPVRCYYSYNQDDCGEQPIVAEFAYNPSILDLLWSFLFESVLGRLLGLRANF